MTTDAGMRIEELCDALAAAWRAGTRLAAADWADAVPDEAAAYAVQRGLVARLGGAGAWKSGGGSRAARSTHAPLPAARVRTAPASFEDLAARGRIVEAEIALRLGSAVDAAEAAALAADARGADRLIDAMAVAIELCDSRWQEGAGAPALLRLADLQSNAGLALGPWQPYRRCDWDALRCTLQAGARAPDERAGGHPLGDPAWGLAAWLAHATEHGALAAGTIVTTGAWCVRAVADGDRVQVRFDGIGEAQLRV